MIGQVSDIALNGDSPGDVNTEAAGRKIAIELLREARAYIDGHKDGNQASIEARYRTRGSLQDNFIAKHLAAVDGRPRAAAGLASVLSDALSGGGLTDVVVYEMADRQLRRRERRGA